MPTKPTALHPRRSEHCPPSLIAAGSRHGYHADGDLTALVRSLARSAAREMFAADEAARRLAPQAMHDV
jgi:hypothetical protein